MHIDDAFRQRVRSALTGPIASIRTPFRQNGSIDYAGVRRMIDLSYASGCKASLLTAGDSHCICMSDKEIAAINRVVIKHTAKRGLTVACDWEFATPQAVEFARYCADLGADVLMARPPDWVASATVETLVEHFAAVAEHLPVMIVTNIFQTRSEKFGLDTLKALLARVPNIVALKEDVGGEFARKASLLTHGRWAVFAGGGLRNHLSMHPYGCDGFMDRHMNFAPQVSHRYWSAIQGNDLAAAQAVIRDIELPLEEIMAAFPGSRDAAIHGLIEIAGIAGRWRRPPYYSLNDEEMARLRQAVAPLGLFNTDRR